jgi:hypothetical protein
VKIDDADVPFFLIDIQSGYHSTVVNIFVIRFRIEDIQTKIRVFNLVDDDLDGPDHCFSIHGISIKGTKNLA